MIGGENNSNSIVILSDDDEDNVTFNENGKRPNSSGSQQATAKSKSINYNDQEDESDYNEDEENYSDDEEMNTEDEEYAMYEQQENSRRNAIYLSRSLPEDHEPVILSERDQVNTLQEINNIFSELKEKVLKPSYTLAEDVETNYSCGGPLNEEAPSIAVNIAGLSGPVAFPMDEKDAVRILEVHPTIDNEKGEIIGLDMDAGHLEISKTFEEYLRQVLLSDVLEYLGVDSIIATNTKLIIDRFHIRTNGGSLLLPSPL